MITKTLQCYWCWKDFERTDYPSRFKVYEKTYCSKECAMIAAQAGYHPIQIMTKLPNGRVMIRIPNHPNVNKNNQIPFAHLIVEARINRFLTKEEIIHHIDENPANDDYSNLQIMSISEHLSYHWHQREKGENGQLLPKMR